MDYMKEIIKKASASMPNTEAAHGSFINAAIGLATMEGNYVRHPQHTPVALVIERLSIAAKHLNLPMVREYLETYNPPYFHVDQVDFDKFIEIAFNLVQRHTVNHHFSKVDLMWLYHLDQERKQAEKDFNGMFPEPLTL